ncbi:MAG: cob(I)yrinic acid a,c-diamide adenosyltransferase [Candidatus Pacebacteria bacterium]|jgi:cob(I)alamin adenosyltransferase|nr:ATP:cob(I)alamin adenosyltransferase [bacterium]MDP6527373.1 cob(I)yrinic acid a,c-diamide adenosyltransferase [Candidatus Paceibacterota bacterium]MDP6659500.1 cob(I)yrinic acid a,c-diamide adenosyltransferase [Candidatus Paceibacterota bacterium]|tara:strand:- start:47057 stop:47608 length:552 start_codon:yes stop_codon:yes gene_type:complete
MLYTGKGDKGETKLFGGGKKVSKASVVSEALGTLDELNSFLGLCKVEAEKYDISVSGQKVENILHDVQKNLFIVQAETAGADKAVEESKLRRAELLINDIESELPPIKAFFISGGTELAARIDVARTLARRAERRVVGVVESKERKLGKYSLAYMNRLSSLLYTLARLSNHKSGISEESPDYK